MQKFIIYFYQMKICFLYEITFCIKNYILIAHFNVISFQYVFVNLSSMSNDVSVTVDQPQEREIPLRHVVDYMKKARANKKRKKNLVLSKQIKDKSESLTEYIESTMKPSTSYQSTTR